ncbi:MAG: delta-60 repeat domain-containing protein, partial [Bacteroidia bacterium]
MKRTLSLLALAGISMSHFLWSQSPGDLDPSFSTNGWLIDGAALNTDLTAVEVMADGRIVAAGVYDFGVNHNIWVCKWRPDGTLDPGFDGDGFAVLPGYFVESDEVDLALQANGKVVVAAWLSDFNSDYSALIRF